MSSPFSQQFRLPPGLFRQPVEYKFSSLHPTCPCGDAVCSIRQQRGFYFLFCDLGVHHEVLWILGRN